MSKILNRLKFHEDGTVSLPSGTNESAKGFSWQDYMQGTVASSTPQDPNRPKADPESDPWGYAGSNSDADNLEFWWDRGAYGDPNKPGADEARPDFCRHDWQEYQGFRESYFFCTVCQKKKSL
jgi:hypothetical protein